MKRAKTNYHTHSTWCDGKNSPEEMAEAAAARGFARLGFSSHALLPSSDPWTLDAATAPEYARDIRRLAEKFAGRMEILCGVEADYIEGRSRPDRAFYAHLDLDYIIGSVHYVTAPDGAEVPVDHTPGLLAGGISKHFGDDARALVRAYFAAQREMAAGCDFDVIGHPDLVRKFNGRMGLFGETEEWYLDELRLTADAFAASGKLVEVNTGAISRGWMDDAYPSPEFRALLRERGVRFVLGSDAHAADAVDCAFDRFADAEDYAEIPPRRSVIRPEALSSRAV